MRSLDESAVEVPQAFANGGGGIDVQGRAKTLGRTKQRHIVTMQDRRRPLFLRLSKERRRSRGMSGGGHFFFFPAVSLTLIATTVWSSKVSKSAAYSATALNKESTTQPPP